MKLDQELHPYPVQRALYAQGRESTQEVNRLRKLAGLPRVKPPTSLEAMVAGEYKGIAVGKRCIHIDVPLQALDFISNGEVTRFYLVSTSRGGIGTEFNSGKTPPGLHRITEKIGANAPAGLVFSNREPQDFLATIYTDKTDVKQDLITSRILWLSGVESTNRNSHARNIYLHGTPEEGLIGTPVSHGCIRLKNRDIIELFDLCSVGTYVLISDGTPLELPIVTNMQPVKPVEAIAQLPLKQIGLKADLSPYFTYIHDDCGVTDLKGLIAAQNLEGVTPRDILSIEDNAQQVYRGLKPIDRLNYRVPTLESYLSANSLGGSPAPAAQPLPIETLETGTRLKLPHAAVKNRKISPDGNRELINTTDTGAFITSALKGLLAETGYEQAFANKLEGTVSKSMPNVSVWIWCKSLGQAGISLYGGEPLELTSEDVATDITGRIYDLTPFIESCSIQVTPTGGTFSLSLPPLTGQVGKEGWEFREASLQEFMSGGLTNFVNRDSIFRVADGEYKTNEFLFHNMIGTNDVVWIRFEPLQNEQGRTPSSPRKPFVNKQELPGKNYDMIGLVDRNALRVDYARSSVSVSVTGRDLMKLLIEDGSTWLNIPNLKPNEGIFYNANWKKFGRTVRRFDRMGPANNPLGYFIGFRAPSIGEVCSILFGSVATVEIAPDSLFSAYPNDDDPETGQAGISKYLQFTEGKGKFVPGAGIWQVMKVLIDDSVKNRTLADDSISTFEGSLINGIQKYVQKPFVELFTDTYRDQFYLIIRKPPTDKAGYLSLVKLCEQVPALTIQAEHVLSDSLMYDDGEVFCWYRLQPRGNLGGTSNNLDPLTMPIIYLREYNEIWGNRSMDIISNYLHRGNMISPNTYEPLDYQTMRKQTEIDLRYMVESNAYLPFTRKGTLTLHGDRRIKRGTVVYYPLTREYFYVDAVANSYQVNGNSTERVTTLTVSRGMVRGKTPEGEEILDMYFDLVNTNKVNFDSSTEPTFDWFVNKKTFNFFLQRLQTSPLNTYA